MFVFIDLESIYGKGLWRNGTVCSYEDDVIASKDECKTLIERLGYIISGNWTIAVDNGSLPSGCSVALQNGNSVSPYFEESATGLGTGRGDLTPICKRTVLFGKNSI